MDSNIAASQFGDIFCWVWPKAWEANPNDNNLMMRRAGLSDIRVWLCRSKNIDPMFNCWELHNTENQWSLSLCPTDSAVRGFSAERRGWGGWVNQCGWDLILGSAGHERGILIVFQFCHDFNNFDSSSLSLSFTIDCISSLALLIPNGALSPSDGLKWVGLFQKWGLFQKNPN